MFRKIREENCYYVDKTGFACQLAEEGTHYFLSRPRRFGKSPRATRGEHLEV
ncbi:MAG: AAA family ATPase [Porticoccaceae bacterium]